MISSQFQSTKFPTYMRRADAAHYMRTYGIPCVASTLAKYAWGRRPRISRGWQISDLLPRGPRCLGESASASSSVPPASSLTAGHRSWTTLIFRTALTVDPAPSNKPRILTPAWSPGYCTLRAAVGPSCRCIQQKTGLARVVIRTAAQPASIRAHKMALKKLPLTQSKSAAGGNNGRTPTLGSLRESYPAFWFSISTPAMGATEATSNCKTNYLARLPHR
jgi:hypothetical protein